MNLTSPEIKKFAQSKRVKHVLYGITVFVAALIIFQAGIFVGYHRAAFSYRFGDNYERTFGMHRGEFHDGAGNPMFGGEFSNAHGSVGKIVSIALPTLMIADRDGVEKVILLDDDTHIRQFRDELTPDQLKVGDMVIAIGSPNDKAQIEAKFIRLLPPSDAPSFASGTPAQ